MEFIKFFLQAGPVGKIVLILLILMSIVSWYFIFLNFFTLRKFKGELGEWVRFLEQNFEFLNVLREVKTYKESLLGQSIRRTLTKFAEVYTFYKEKVKEERAILLAEAEKELEETYSIEREKVLLDLGQGLGFLATTASTAPFIGLFGTVWGIMQSFHEIGIKGSATLATVAPGIAEALINTAMGLFVAIPASIAYNTFLLKRERLGKELEVIYRKIKIISKRELLKGELAKL